MTTIQLLRSPILSLAAPPLPLHTPTALVRTARTGRLGLYMDIYPMGPTDPVRVEEAMAIHRLMGVRGGWVWAWG